VLLHSSFRPSLALNVKQQTPYILQEIMVGRLASFFFIFCLLFVSVGVSIVWGISPFSSLLLLSKESPQEAWQNPL
jgi:hypothetical protein